MDGADDKIPFDNKCKKNMYNSNNLHTKSNVLSICDEKMVFWGGQCSCRALTPRPMELGKLAAL